MQLGACMLQECCTATCSAALAIHYGFENIWEAGSTLLVLLGYHSKLGIVLESLEILMRLPAVYGVWAARYNTWRFTELTLTGVVFSFLFFSFQSMVRWSAVNADQWCGSGVVCGVLQ